MLNASLLKRPALVSDIQCDNGGTLVRKIRIDRDDADFVDIIHTDAGDFDMDEFMSVLGIV